MVLVGASILTIVCLQIADSAVVLRRHATHSVEVTTQAVTRDYAARIKANLDRAMGTALAVGQTFQAVKNDETPLVMSRESASLILRNILSENPGLSAIYTMWEPDAFDNQDTGYAGADRHDATGRFLPCWRRAAANELEYTILSGIEQDLYLRPKRTRQATLLKPQLKGLVSGQQPVISLVAPVMRDDEFYAVVGVDMSMRWLQNLVDYANIHEGRGSLKVIARDGTIVAASGRRDLEGLDITRLRPDADRHLSHTRTGREFVRNDAGGLEIYTPIMVDQVPSIWSVVAYVPQAVVASQVQAQILRQVAIGAVMILVAMALVIFISNNIARPIQRLRTITRRVAGGELDQDLKINSRDEIGDLAHDFSEMLAARKENEEALAAITREANAANRSKSAFLANMSHEIRTPMTAILGYTDLLEDGELPRDKQRTYLQTIRRNGDYLLRIINDILDLSKIDSGKMELEHIATDVCQLIEDVRSLMQVRATEKQIELNIEYTFPLPGVIKTDPLRLRQILVNLVGNAIKFTTEGGVRILVRTDMNDEQPQLQIEVIDTGIGMSTEQVEHLFQPFMQADVSTTRQFGGTGLGLTISKRLAEGLGGGIAINSFPGSGSSFRVAVNTGPLDQVSMIHNPWDILTALDENKQTDHDAAVAANEELQLAGTVLLVEDTPVNQKLCTTILRKAGLAVETAENGQIGYEMAMAAKQAGHPFDLVLMDMQMPVLDGYAATGRLRDEGYEGPIIALTAHAMLGDREKCLDAGCNDYATKPFHKRKLLTAIAGQLHKTPA